MGGLVAWADYMGGLVAWADYTGGLVARGDYTGGLVAWFALYIVRHAAAWVGVLDM
jgi:hypothetical protein